MLVALVRNTLAYALVALLCGAGCSDGGRPADPTGARARFDVSPSAGFFDAPFPIPTRALPGGGVRVDDFPNPRDNLILGRVLTALARPPVGFGTTSAIYLPFDGPIDEQGLPDAAGSLADGAAVLERRVEPTPVAKLVIAWRTCYLG